MCGIRLYFRRENEKYKRRRYCQGADFVGELRRSSLTVLILSYFCLLVKENPEESAFSGFGFF